VLPHQPHEPSALICIKVEKLSNQNDLAFALTMRWLGSVYGEGVD